jgi:hypothetical protein
MDISLILKRLRYL